LSDFFVNTDHVKLNSHRFRDTIVERLADDFANRIPESEFSPAEVLSLLLEHRLSPKSAVVSVEAWVARVREKSKGIEIGRVSCCCYLGWGGIRYAPATVY
jgi:hypothetical protein